MFSESPGSGGRQDREVGPPAPVATSLTPPSRVSECALKRPKDIIEVYRRAKVQARNPRICAAEFKPLSFTSRRERGRKSRSAACV